MHRSFLQPGSHERVGPRSDVVAGSRARGLSSPPPLFFEPLEREVRQCCGRRLQSSDEPRNRTEYFRIPGIRDTSPSLSPSLVRRPRWCSLQDLAWPETSAIPSPAGSLKPSDIAPSGLHKSKTPGPLFAPCWVRPPRGPNPTIRLAVEPNRPIPHNQLSNNHRLRRRRPGAASSAEQQRFEVHRSFRRHAAVVEEHRRAIKSNIADSLHVVIQIERRPGRRYISEVLEINSYDPDADLFDYCAIYRRQEVPQ